MSINGKRANSGDTSLDAQLESIRSMTPPEPLSVAPPPEGDQVARSDAEASQLAETEASQPAETIGDGLVVIGKGAKIIGEITNCSQVEIAGALEGNVVAEAVIIRAGGRLKGTVYSERAEVHGTLEGQIQVQDHLDIRSTGHVSGELAYGTLSIEPGGRLAGNIQLCSDLQKEDPAAEPLEAGSFTDEFLAQSTT